MEFAEEFQMILLYVSKCRKTNWLPSLQNNLELQFPANKNIGVRITFQ